MQSILTQRSAAGKWVPGGVLAAIALAAFFVPGLPLQAASPDLQTTVPRGGQRGKEIKVTFTGNRLDDAEEVLFHYPGISFKELKPLDAKKVEATLVIAPDCRLGEHHLRLRTRSGISYARNFWVSQFPTVEEKEPNDSFEEPQRIDLNVTVEGVAKPEDTDYYQVSLKKGQRLSVEVEAMRINTRRNVLSIDPYVAILDKDRFELAAADGSTLLKQESILTAVAPEDGDYVVEVRDTAYQGNGRYRAHIGTFPRPMTTYPLGGKAGSEVEVTLLGDEGGEFKSKVKLPGGVEEYLLFAEKDGLLPPSPNRLRVSEFGDIFDVEPNNTSKEATDGGALPLAFNGILEEEGDYDYFKFTAKKGQRFRMQVYARELGSPLDPVLTVYDAKMKSLGNNDDADGTKDSRVDFNCPADGEYFVRIRDMLGRGGPDYVYRIESQPDTPRIEVTMPEMQRRDFQYRKQFVVPRGNHYAMVVSTSRKLLSGDLVFDLPELPEGVAWEAGTIPKSASQFPILLKAEPDAPIAGGFYKLFAKTADAEKEVKGQFVQKLDLVRGPQNGVEYYTPEVPDLPVAVAEKVPFSVSIVQPKVPIVRDGTMKLKLRAAREKGFDKKITFRMLWKPPGISAPATVSMGEKETEIEYELNANGNAELGTWNITFLAEADAGKGPMVVATPFAKLEVAEPFVGMELTMATAKQGEKVDMVAKVENLKEFDGEASVQLFGLPAKSSTEVLKIKKDTDALRFPVTVAEDTPVGQHKNLFCTVVVNKDGEPITHRVGKGGVIRVDPKPKEPAKPKEKPKEVAKNDAKKQEKPLSRLEQLRLEAQQEASAK